MGQHSPQGPSWAPALLGTLGTGKPSGITAFLSNIAECWSRYCLGRLEDLLGKPSWISDAGIFRCFLKKVIQKKSGPHARHVGMKKMGKWARHSTLLTRLEMLATWAPWIPGGLTWKDTMTPCFSSSLLIEN